MEQLSGQDASFVYMETPTTPMHIGSVAIYDPSTAAGGMVRFKDILRFIESRLGAAKSFRQKLVRVPFNLDHPYWVEDPAFDLEYHVRHIALPQPGDWRQLCIQVARLHARPLDMTKPLWEFWIVEGLNNIDGVPPGSWALVSKVHHAAIDGMSGVEMSSAVHDLTPDMPDRPSKGEWKPEADPTLIELMIRTQVNNIRQPLRFAETVWNTIPGLARLGKQIAGGDVSIAGTKMAPKTRFNGKVSSYRVFDGVSFPLTDIRAIKDSLPGATVNDAILAVIGGGLRKYLDDKNELPGESMSAMAPISVRADNEKQAMGNLVSAMVVNLGTHIADPLKRLAYIHKEAKNSKAMTNAVGARTLTDYSQLLPSALAGLGARLYTRLGVANAHAPVFNCVATNVPGSPIPIYFCGAKLVKMFGLGPIFDSMGMINTIYSYCGDIAVSFTADRQMLPDPAQYASALKASFEELKAAAITPPKAKRTVPHKSKATVTKPIAPKGLEKADTKMRAIKSKAKPKSKRKITTA
jgi:diacylglycerol O-acyltransferase / wax synthase